MYSYVSPRRSTLAGTGGADFRTSFRTECTEGSEMTKFGFTFVCESLAMTSALPLSTKGLLPKPFFSTRFPESPLCPVARHWIADSDEMILYSTKTPTRLCNSGRCARVCVGVCVCVCFSTSLSQNPAESSQRRAP